MTTFADSAVAVLASAESVALVFRIARRPQPLSLGVSTAFLETRDLTNGTV